MQAAVGLNVSAGRAVIRQNGLPLGTFANVWKFDLDRADFRGASVRRKPASPNFLGEET